MRVTLWTNVCQPTLTLIKCSSLCKLPEGLILAHENAHSSFPFLFIVFIPRGGGRPVSPSLSQSLPPIIRQKHTRDMSPNQTTGKPSNHTPRAKLESPNHPMCVIVVVCRRKMKCTEKTHAGTDMGEYTNEANNHCTAVLPLVRM